MVKQIIHKHIIEPPKRFGKSFISFLRNETVAALAVAVVLGAAIKSLTDALVGDLVSPLIGLAIPNVKDLQSWKLGNFAIGHFLKSALDFLILTLALYILIKWVLKPKKSKMKPAA